MNIIEFDPRTAPITSKEVWSLRPFNHISHLKKNSAQSPKAFICYTSHWLNPMYAYGYSLTQICIYVNQAYWH